MNDKSNDVSAPQQDVRPRIREIIAEKCGRVDEALMTGGILDSVSAVELAMTLEEEFAREPDSFALSDFATLTTLSKRVLALRGAPERGAR